MATGYLVGAVAIFIPVFGLVMLAVLVSGAPFMVNGEAVEGGWSIGVVLMQLIMLLVVLAMQAVMLGGLIVFGLWLYQKRRPIRVVEGPPQ